MSGYYFLHSKLAFPIVLRMPEISFGHYIWNIVEYARDKKIILLIYNIFPLFYLCLHLINFIHKQNSTSILTFLLII
jgi:hypothetical protein